MASMRLLSRPTGDDSVLQYWPLAYRRRLTSSIMIRMPSPGYRIEYRVLSTLDDGDGDMASASPRLQHPPSTNYCCCCHLITSHYSTHDRTALLLQSELSTRSLQRLARLVPSLLLRSGLRPPRITRTTLIAPAWSSFVRRVSRSIFKHSHAARLTELLITSLPRGWFTELAADCESARRG